MFFGNTNKINEPLTIIIKKKREKTLINEIRNERAEITTRYIKKDYNILWTTICHEIGQPGQMDKFLELCNLPKVNQEEAEYLNRLVTTN